MNIGHCIVFESTCKEEQSAYLRTFISQGNPSVFRKRIVKMGEILVTVSSSLICYFVRKNCGGHLGYANYPIFEHTQGNPPVFGQKLMNMAIAEHLHRLIKAILIM